MATSSTLETVIQRKLEVFKQLQPEFEACFQFIQEVHGQRRFTSFSVANVVRYLHAFWLCECKDRLLSVYRNITRYEGRYCLQLLRLWQEEEDTASVIDFLHRKLDMLPLADITRQLHEAQRVHHDDGLARRLAHGRIVLLNRGITLMQALDAVFTLSEENLLKEVQAACELYGHLPHQIEQQLQELDSPLYAYVLHQALAQRNMEVMNKLGVSVTFRPADLPGRRSWRVVAPIEPLSPYAEHVVLGYQELLSPLHNNIMANRFVDRPEHSSDQTLYNR
ncbi:MAG TPA: hypothetical protein VKR06_17055 [Ktedonosporobacter sp.]|nr:hypothetical protein [Ktedonosporobacter sp.]